MSTKLNSEELAAKRYPESDDVGIVGQFQDGCKAGYFFAIEEVAQPIADERDKLLKALKMCHTQMRYHAREHAELLPTGKYNSADYEATHEADEFARRLLSKYPKP